MICEERGWGCLNQLCVPAPTSYWIRAGEFISRSMNIFSATVQLIKHALEHEIYNTKCQMWVMHTLCKNK